MAEQPRSGFSRRTLLGGAASAGLTPTLLPGIAAAAAPLDRRLIVVILRGGLDGLAAVVPYADRAYEAARGSLALPAAGAEGGPLDLDGFFGLNPALESLLPLYRSGQMLAAHAVASPYRERSHFDAQNLLETGADRPYGRDDGWLNRAVALVQGADPTYALSIGNEVPLLLRGEAPVGSFTPGGRAMDATDLIDTLTNLYAADPLFHQALTQGIESRAMAASAMEGMRGGRSRRFGDVVTPLARMMADEGRARIAVASIGGWDTHANQGTTGGQLFNRLKDLGDGLAELADAMGPVWAKTAVLVMTEFGRTVAANGTGGSDHGTGGVAFLLGGAVDGGRVLADWPGLDRLHEGRDLAPTLDLRALATALLTDHLGLPAAEVERHVLPGTPAAVGELIRA